MMHNYAVIVTWCTFWKCHIKLHFQLSPHLTILCHLNMKFGNNQSQNGTPSGGICRQPHQGGHYHFHHTNIEAFTGPDVCAFLVLLCCLFIQVQIDYNNDVAVPFFFHAAITLYTVITSLALLFNIFSKQVNLVSYLVLTCLDNIFQCSGK